MSDPATAMVKTKTVVKRRPGWGDGTFEVGDKLEILERMETHEGWEVVSRQERPYYTGIQFFGDDAPRDETFYGKRWRSMPPDTPITFDIPPGTIPDVLALVNDDQRWHEIATEGLPKGVYVLVWVGTYPTVAISTPGSNLGDWLDMDERHVYPVTHWRPLPAQPPGMRCVVPITLPAPPTKEPR